MGERRKIFGERRLDNSRPKNSLRSLLQLAKSFHGAGAPLELGPGAAHGRRHDVAASALRFAAVALAVVINPEAAEREAV